MSGIRKVVADSAWNDVAHRGGGEMRFEDDLCFHPDVSHVHFVLFRAIYNIHHLLNYNDKTASTNCDVIIGRSLSLTDLIARCQLA